jgi:hypothetical protein
VHEPIILEKASLYVLYYHGKYFNFSTGGIDFKVPSAEPSKKEKWDWVSIKDQVEFEAIHSSVKRQFGVNIDKNDNRIGFQIYDSFAEETLSSAIVSPFSYGYRSTIRSISLKPQLVPTRANFNSNAWKSPAVS